MLLLDSEQGELHQQKDQETNQEKGHGMNREIDRTIDLAMTLIEITGMKPGCGLN